MNEENKTQIKDLLQELEDNVNRNKYYLERDIDLPNIKITFFDRLRFYFKDLLLKLHWLI
jgi:hypothetical protein